jgi:RimJ/RimL family protein N-acetyltransferase
MGARSERTTVHLEPWGEGDLALLQETLGDPEMTRHIGGPEDRESIAQRQIGYEQEDSRQFKIVEDATGAATGWVGYWELTWRDEQIFEIGWSVLPGFQGRGIGSRAAARAIELARNEGTLRVLHAFPSVDNAPSNAICRKLGFTLREECEFEYPAGNFMRVNDWSLDLAGRPTIDEVTPFGPC